MIYKVLGAALAGIVAYALLKSYRPEYAVVSEFACAAVILYLVAGELGEVRGFFLSAMEASGVGAEWASGLFKVLGTALITQFAADAARDNGQSALAQKIEFAGKALILVLTVPVLKAVLQLVLAIGEDV